jgi:hypothetical protein
MVKRQIEHLKNPAAQGGAHSSVAAELSHTGAAKASDDQRLARLEQLVQEMNDRLKAIEGNLLKGAKP